MSTLRLLWRATREVFHETIAAFFFFFAVLGVLGALRQWQNPATRWVAGLDGGYAALMASFAAAAFRDSRRVR
ncbi:MAG TPA: hypothetical protein VNJ12_02775 [Candidatus Dormibacteraeota bacterium]|nr:hypothetical protein [Candidatus Dormibacteraeota bacterium]